jgi:serine O-acetyltransferase
MILATCLMKLIEVTCGISISFSAQIGEGFYIGHFGGIFIHKDVTIGKYCNISQGVSIGLGGRGPNTGSPVLGDRIYIGPNVVLCGRITIGNDVAIGANAVVTKSIPKTAVVAGIPAKIISFEGSSDFVVFRGTPSKLS